MAGPRLQRTSVLLPCILALALASCGGEKPFSSREWKASVEARRMGSDLQGMARSLIRTRALVGKSRAEVVDLLGEGETNLRGMGKGSLGWVVDELPVLLSITIFEVHFDGEGRVTEAELREQGC